MIKNFFCAPLGALVILRAYLDPTAGICRQRKSKSRLQDKLSWRKCIRRANALLSAVFVFSGFFLSNMVALAQTKRLEGVRASQESGEGQLPSPAAMKTENTVPGKYDDAIGDLQLMNAAALQNQQTINGGVQDILTGKYTANVFDGEASSLAIQAAEQGEGPVIQRAANNILNFSLGSVNDTYKGLHQWWKDDLVGNLFQNIGQLFGKWMAEFNKWLCDCIRMLSKALLTFVLNPNIAVNGLNGSPDDGISRAVRQAADLMYSIAIDLLLLLFLCCIWKFWADAAWGGAGNLMSPVGRLIFTSGLMLAWPTIYAFEIQITNEMIVAVFGDPESMLKIGDTLVAAMGGGLVAAGAGALKALAPALAKAYFAPGWAWTGEVFAFGSSIVFTLLGSILVAELVYIVILKAVQTALLTAQYMFAPIFLVFFAIPDTESYATTYVKAFVETSLWTFVWVGLLKVLSIVILSDYNPWGKILLAIGVLQLMIQVPSFLGRAQISPASDFVSAGQIFGRISKCVDGARTLADKFFDNKSKNDSGQLDASSQSEIPLCGAYTGRAAVLGASFKNGLNQMGETLGKGNSKKGMPISAGASVFPAGSQSELFGTANTDEHDAQGPPEKINNEHANFAAQFQNSAGKMGLNNASRTQIAAKRFLDKMSASNNSGLRCEQVISSIIGSVKGGVKGLNIAEGESVIGTARAIYAGAFADNVCSDEHARESATVAAIASGGDKPRSIEDKRAANWLSASNVLWSSTPRGKQQFDKAVFDAAVEGAKAYVGAQPGNAYTDYLRSRYGTWGAEQDANAVHAISNPESVDSPLNRNIGPATDSLIASGMPVNGAGLGAMQNPLIQRLHPTRKKQAALAALWATYRQAKSAYGGEDDYLFQRAHGELARSLPDTQLNAAVGIYQSNGQEDLISPLSSRFISISSDLAARTKTDIAASYSSMKEMAPLIARRIGVLVGADEARSSSSLSALYNSVSALPGHSREETFEMILQDSSSELITMHNRGITLNSIGLPGHSAPTFEFIHSRAPGGLHSDAARDGVQVVEVLTQNVNTINSPNIDLVKRNIVGRLGSSNIGELAKYSVAK